MLSAQGISHGVVLPRHVNKLESTGELLEELNPPSLLGYEYLLCQQVCDRLVVDVAYDWFAIVNQMSPLLKRGDPAEALHRPPRQTRPS